MKALFLGTYYQILNLLRVKKAVFFSFIFPAFLFVLFCKQFHNIGINAVIIQKLVFDVKRLLFVRNEKLDTHKRNIVIKRRAGNIGFSVLFAYFYICFLRVFETGNHFKSGGIRSVLDREGERGFKRFRNIFTCYGYNI